MKSLTFFGLAALLVVPTFAQAQSAATTKSDTPPPTKLEAFSSKKGLLLIRDSNVSGRIVRYNVGKEQKIGVFKTYEEQKAVTDYDYSQYAEITAAAVYEPSKENNKVKGINIYVADLKSRVASSSISTLDVEETESLSQALDYMINLSKKWKGQDLGDKRASFKTVDNFEVSLSQDAKGEQSFTLSSGRINETTMRLRVCTRIEQMRQTEL